MILAALLTLFIIQNLFQPGLPTLADLPIHLYRTMEYERAWAPGVIVPRWSPNLVYGYGYPVFVFVPPLAYWLGLVFHALGFTFETAFKNLIILTILLYALGMYLLARDLLGSAEAGLVAATAYAFAPFALREALLYGGNMPQFLAIGLFPWALWAITRAAWTHTWNWTILAALFYTGVLLSHLFQALIFTAVVGLYGLIQFILTTDQPFGTVSALLRRPAKIATNAQALLPILLGLLLAAFFWIPAFSERFYTRAQTAIYLEKSPFFVRYPQWSDLIAWIQPLDTRAANPYVPLTLGVITLTLAALGLLSTVKVWRTHLSSPSPLYRLPSTVYRLPSTVYLILFFAAIAATAIFMALPISRPVWETITILQVAQFPWRMLGLANLGLAFLAGSALLFPPPTLRRPIATVCVLLQLVAVAPYLYPVTGFTHYDQVTIADQIDYERRSQLVGTTTLGEYLPQTVRRPPTSSPLVETFRAGQFPERLDRSSLPAGATATLLEQTAVTHRYRLDSPAAFTLRFFQFDYPGWRAMLDSQEIEIRPEAESGLMLIDIPAGQHTLVVHFGETPGRIVALGITGLTLAGLAGLSLVRWATAGSWLSKQKEAREDNRSSLTSAPGGRPLMRLLPYSPVTLAGMLLIVAGALWLKPLLRPIFTITSPPDQALPAQYKTELKFAEGIELIGYDLNRRVVPAGGHLQVVLYWQTKGAPLQANLQPFVHLDRLNNFTTIADATNYAPGDMTTESNLPTFHWDNHRYIRDEHDLIIPPATPPLAYAVRVGMLDPAQNRLLPLAGGSGDTAFLTTLNVAPPRRQPLKLAQPLEVAFGNGPELIHLIGFELDALTPERLDFSLAWRTDQTPLTDYTIFAQLLDRENRLVASFDQPPLAGAYPTSTWLPGQTIIDPRSIPLGKVAPGEYRLMVGLYNSVTQQRLLTKTGNDFVELTSITVGEP